jgi:hypothetical protein
MADFGAVSEGIYLDDEYLSLPPEQRGIWLTLCTSPIGGRTGIFKGGVAVLVGQTGWPAETITDALAAFEQLGWIVRDGDYTWVRNRIKHRGWNIHWRNNAFIDVEALIAKTPLAAQCLEYYAEQRARDKEVLANPKRSTAKQGGKNQAAAAQEPDNNTSSTPVEQDNNPGTSLYTKQSNLIQSNQESLSAETAGAVPARRKSSNRIKPEQPSYEDELKRLPPECLPAWQKFEAMVASHNQGKTVAPSRMHNMLAAFLARCENLPPAALTHGLTEATTRGKDGPGYAATCAESWRASPAPAQAVFRDEPDLPTADDALRERVVRLDPALLDPSAQEEPCNVPVQ